MKKLTVHFAVTLVTMFILSAGPARAQSFAITGAVIAGGGGTSTNGAFAVSGTIGQPVAETVSQGGGFAVQGGFWQAVTLVQVPEVPMLRYTRAGDQITIYWEPAATGFILEWTDNLQPPANWQTVTGVTNNQLQLQPVSGARYFRLRHGP